MSITIQPTPSAKRYRDPGAPTLNVGIGNLAPLFAVVGIDPGEYHAGDIPASDVWAAYLLCNAAMAATPEAFLARARMMRGVVHVGRFTVNAATDEAALLRLRGLSDVLHWAAVDKRGISWD